LAPRVVVAISSPDPTIEAERINPGPRNLIFLKNFSGGSRTESCVNMYGSEFSVRFPDLKYWDNQQFFVCYFFKPI
jgi:hypothetical protein